MAHFHVVEGTCENDDSFSDYAHAASLCYLILRPIGLTSSKVDSTHACQVHVKGRRSLTAHEKLEESVLDAECSKMIVRRAFCSEKYRARRQALVRHCKKSFRNELIFYQGNRP